MVGSARPDEGEDTLLASSRALRHLAASLSSRTGWRTEAVQTLPTDVSPIVKGGDGAPGLAQTLRSALRVTDTVVGEGEDTLGAR